MFFVSVPHTIIFPKILPVSLGHYAYAFHAAFDFANIVIVIQYPGVL
jgi:hypothetical protein